LPTVSVRAIVTTVTSQVIGRESELSTIHAFLGGANEAHAAVVLEGEPGIGKSTLWLAGLDVAQERGLRVVSSRPAEADAGLAFAGLGDLLDGVLDEVLPLLASPRRRALEGALLLEELEGRVDPRALAVAVRDALEALAASGPLVVAVDDVQWLDRASLDALAFSVRRVEAPVLALLSRRDVGDGVRSPLELAFMDASVARVHLGPLSLGAIQALLRDRLRRVFPRPTLLKIHESSGGNPFYALELARALGPHVDPVRPLAVPPTLDGLLSSRLAGLPNGTRATLAYVAAVGAASPRLLAAVGADAEALEPARSAGVIVDVDRDVRFAHPLLGSALYQALGPSERHRVHEKLSQVLEDPLDRARHLALSTDEPDRAVAAALEDAASLAGRRGAPSAAGELGEHAFRRTPAAEVADACRRALAAAHAYLAAGEVARARMVAHELESCVPGSSAHADVLLLRTELEPGNLQGRIAARREALRDPALEPDQRLMVHQKLALMLRFTESLDVAQEHARVAVELAEELGDDASLGGSLGALALLRFTAGEPDALELAERGYALARRAGRPQAVIEAEMCLSHILTWSVELQRARALLEQLVAEWSERDERFVAQALWYLALVELRAGRLDVAAEHAERSRELSLLYGRDDTEDPQDLFATALVAAYRGQLEGARHLVEAALPIAEQQRALLPGLDAALGLVALWSGEPTAAVERFGAAERAASAAGWVDPARRFWRGDYAEALLALGRSEDAVRVVDAWEAAGTRLGMEWVLAEAARCRGLVAAGRGDLDDARRLLEAAAAKHERVGDRFGRARSLLALGVVLRRARQKRASREAVEEATRIFEACLASGWADKARAELGRVGGRRREEGLTAAERRVAALVAEGRTNREVAAALVLGERTVETHLTHIYAKLGVRSRTELARTLASKN
jgi:DNA-binding CsgD family transcriptional regulator